MHPMDTTSRLMRTSGLKRVVSRILATVVLLGSFVVAAEAVHPAASQAASSALRRYPYASEVVGNSATVNWATDRSQTTGDATWGAVTNGVCTPSNSVPATSVAITVGSTAEYQWSARLAFPGPGTYCYRIQLGTTDLLGSDPSPQLKTAAAPGSPFSFAVVGDFGAVGGGSTGEAGVMGQIGAGPASFVVSTGDSDNENGSQTNYGDLTQGNVFPSSYLPKIGSRPIFAAQGNHGFTNNLPYLQNFPAPLAAQVSGGRNLPESYSGTPYASSWYAFDWGGARFYVLEAAWADSQGGYQGDFSNHWNGPVSGCGPCGAELAWLKADLAAHAGKALKFAFFHYPLYADSSGQGSDTYLDGPTGLEGLLAANGVDVVFNGHAHIYERNLPQIPGKPMVSYVTGAGGATLGSVSGCSPFAAYAVGSGSSCHAPTPTSDAHVYEYLLVTVNGNQVTVTPTDSTGQTFDQQTYTFGTPSTPPPPTSPPPPINNANGNLQGPVTGMASLPDGSGYWLADAHGGVSAHGNAVNYGSMAGKALNAPVNHIVATPDGMGYWLVAADGGTFTFGDAGFYGSTGNTRLNAPVVDIGPTQDGKGYWLVASDGGIFTFGDAQFFGSMGGVRLNKPVVGISPDYTSGGYWLVATDGGIFSFNAPFYGSTGNIVLNQPVNGMAPTPSGHGYWFVASDGGIFSFGDAQFYGSMGGTRLNAPIVGMATDNTTGGYWLVASDGGVFTFNTPFFGAN